MILKGAGKLDSFMKFMKGMPGKASTLGKQTGEMGKSIYNTAKGTAMGGRIGKLTKDVSSGAKADLFSGKPSWNLYGKKMKGNIYRAVKGHSSQVRRDAAKGLWNTAKANPYKTLAVGGAAGVGVAGAGATVRGVGKMIRRNRDDPVR